MKKIVFLLVVIMSVIVPASSVMANATVTSQNSFPDLLGDDFEDDDEWDDEYDDDFDREEIVSISDPLEPLNRVFFTFNDKVYEWVLSPLTDGYIWALPRDLRESFGNFFYNLAAPVRFVNSILQGELRQSGVVLSRFLINSTLGVYGLVDIANLEFDIKPRKADFGQTLGRWGVGGGVYICWPVVGPSSIRDSVGLFVDAYTHPIPYFHESRVLDISYYTSNKVNTLSLNPDIYDDLKRFSLDPYIASRQAYYDYRKALIGYR
ncbi:MAG: phospholipid-binding lipoprotein MlaA [Desulforhopalus sp.]|jgi:phospholipid-binding lipoprotein MlaA